MEITIHFDWTTLLIGTLLGLLLGFFFRLLFLNRQKETVMLSEYEPMDLEQPLLLTPSNNTLVRKTKSKRKYQNSKLLPADKERIMIKVVNCMEQEKVFKESNLTLTKLAKKLNVPKHQLSQTINEQMAANFLDFINTYRVEAAKRRLQNANTSPINLLAIGKEVGFNSKSTFYAVFKRYTDKTPGEYRNAFLK